MAASKKFQEVVPVMRTACSELAQGTFGAIGRPWLDFQELAVVGKFDFAGVAKMFDTKPASDDFLSVKKQQGKAKDAITAKLSADFVDGLEMDFRMRQRSRIRMFVHSANRYAMHGRPDGPLTVNTTTWLEGLAKDTKKESKK